MDEKFISDLKKVIYIVEIKKRYKRMKIWHFLIFAIIVCANATAGVLLNINTVMFFLESFVLGLTLGKYWLIKKHNFLCDVEAFWKSQGFDKTQEL